VLDDVPSESQGEEAQLPSIARMNFFVVPTVRFRLLWVWFAIDHGRRKILHFDVTENSNECWVIQQLRETFPEESSHRYRWREAA
jgi:hypothetical protein